MTDCDLPKPTHVCYCMCCLVCGRGVSKICFALQAVLQANAGSNIRTESAQQQREGAGGIPAQPQQQEQPDMLPIDAWLGQRGGVEASSIAQLEALEASAASPRQQPASPANGAALAPWETLPGLPQDEDAVSSREAAKAKPWAASGAGAVNGSAAAASMSSGYSPGAIRELEAGSSRAGSGPGQAGQAGGSNGAASGYNGNGASTADAFACDLQTL